MPGPARAGVLIFAKDLDRLSQFYRSLLSMQAIAMDPALHVLESDDLQLVIHAMPAHMASAFDAKAPPRIHENQTVKAFFTVPSLSGAEATASSLGGGLFGPAYPGPGFTLRNAHDPECNVFQLREFGT